MPPSLYKTPSSITFELAQRRKRHVVLPLIIAASFFVIAILAVFFLGFTQENDTHPKISVTNRRLLVDGKPFFLRGVNWSPVPIGVHSSRFGYTLESAAELRRRAEEDAPVIAAGGFNAVKVFSAWQNADFVDAMYAQGLWVVAGPVENMDDDELLRYVKTYSEKEGLLMWVVGSGWSYNVFYEGRFRTLREAADYINATCTTIKRNDPFNRPVSSVYGDFSETGIEWYDRMSCIDVWGTTLYTALDDHVYTGRTFDGKLQRARARHTDRALFVGEYGIDAYNANAGRQALRDQAAAIGNMATELEENYRDWTGGFLFEWQDEWWKAQSFEPESPKVATHEAAGWDPRMFGDGVCSPQCTAQPNDPCSCYYSEEWWGIVDARRNYTCLEIGRTAPGCSLRPAFFEYQARSIPQSIGDTPDSASGW